MNTKEIQAKWNKEKVSYATKEVGSGVQKFVKDALKSEAIFNLKEGLISTPLTKRKNEFTEESPTKAGRKADIIIYISSDIIIPVEIEKYGNLKAGLDQLFQYQLDLDKKYGILTDGYTWQFYNNAYLLKEFNLDRILNNSEMFREFWREYIKTEFYYLSFFENRGQLTIFPEDISIDRKRQDFFRDITTLIRSLKNKLQIEGYLEETDKKQKEKIAVEITYAYIIQFLLYKTLVDNSFGDFKKEFKDIQNSICECLKVNQFGKILGTINGISTKISKNIYRPFAKEQEFITNRLLELFNRPKNYLHEVSPWLDIFIFIKKYNLANVRNDIFGYIYENYLKELYEDKKKGQYFTDPEVVNFMLKKVGYDPENIANRLKNKPEEKYISIIDPSCGSGTFLYSAVNQIIDALSSGSKDSSIKAEKLVTENIFGLDIAEFPLYLAEMNILMRLLPLIINEKYNNPIEKKIKIFKTKDSISEFFDTPLKSTMHDVEVSGGQLDLGFKTAQRLDYKSYMREEIDLEEMKNSLKGHAELIRRRFDFVVGNPPYISFKECSKQKVLFFELMKKRKIKMSNIYGVNLHSTPDAPKKYAPNPNLYAFFIALGIALLKDNGKLCYIIPQTLLTAGDLDVIRYHLAKFTTIETIITFSGKMFVGRGLKQDKLVPTSSLIFVINRKIPSETNKVKIINYRDRNDDIKETLQNILNDKKTSKKDIPQIKLLQNFINWNIIKQSKDFLDFYEEYNKNTADISVYYEHSLAEQVFGTRFYFDRGLKYPKNKINCNLKISDKKYSIAKYIKNRFKALASPNYIDSQLLDFPFGSQGEIVYEQKYKIVWSYINYDIFRFSEETIMIDYNNVLISSNNKEELLYLLAILNSRLTVTIIDSFVRNENEKDILIGIKTIKEFVRIPEIAKGGKNIKLEVIKRTEEMLALEDRILSDYVDFSRIMVQKYDSISIKNANLVLEKDNEIFNLPIKQNAILVKKSIEQKYNEQGLKFEKSSHSLSELKSLPVIDFDKQQRLKDYIDDLVFALYLGISLGQLGLDKSQMIINTCAKNRNYKLFHEHGHIEYV